jgi:hypothetical protein
VTPPTARLEDLRGYAFKPIIDVQGHQVPWCSCLPVIDYRFHRGFHGRTSS